jgi:hypothetical protein
MIFLTSSLFLILQEDTDNKEGQQQDGNVDNEDSIHLTLNEDDEKLLIGEVNRNPIDNPVQFTQYYVFFQDENGFSTESGM